MPETLSQYREKVQSDHPSEDQKGSIAVISEAQSAIRRLLPQVGESRLMIANDHEGIVPIGADGVEYQGRNIGYIHERVVRRAEQNRNSREIQYVGVHEGIHVANDMNSDGANLSHTMIEGITDGLAAKKTGEAVRYTSQVSDVRDISQATGIRVPEMENLYLAGENRKLDALEQVAERGSKTIAAVVDISIRVRRNRVDVMTVLMSGTREEKKKLLADSISEEQILLAA